MSIRYLSNLVLALAAGFLVIATQVFSATTAMWLTFAIATGAAAISAGVVPFKVGLLQRGLSAVAFVVSAWTIVASLIFAPATVATLGFAAGLALVGLAVVGLTAHELTTERVVHSFEVDRHGEGDRNGRVAEREPIAA